VRRWWSESSRRASGKKKRKTLRRRSKKTVRHRLREKKSEFSIQGTKGARPSHCSNQKKRGRKVRKLQQNQEKLRVWWRLWSKTHRNGRGVGTRLEDHLESSCHYQKGPATPPRKKKSPARDCLSWSGFISTKEKQSSHTGVVVWARGRT